MNMFARRTLDVLGWHHHDGAAAAHMAQPDGREPLGALIQVWCRQIDAATTHGTKSVDSLTQVFAQIERQLAEAIDMTQNAAQAMGGAGGGMGGAAEQARHRLEHVIGLIEGAVSANHQLFDAVTEAVQAVRELNETAASVEKISQMTTLLSINARIEAARAGEAGQGFSVVADEVRRLAAQSRQESQTIMARVARIESVIQDTASKAEALRKRDTDLIEQSRQDMVQILDELNAPVQGVMDAADALCQIGQSTRSSVSEALMEFQFMDRIGQRLAHVHSSMALLGHELHTDWPQAHQVAELDRQLMASYTMQEEKRTHRNEPEPADDNDGLVMF